MIAYFLGGMGWGQRNRNRTFAQRRFDGTGAGVKRTNRINSWRAAGGRQPPPTCPRTQSCPGHPSGQALASSQGDQHPLLDAAGHLKVGGHPLLPPKALGPLYPRWWGARIAGAFLLPSPPGWPTWAKKLMGVGDWQPRIYQGDLGGECSTGVGCTGFFSSDSPMGAGRHGGHLQHLLT